MSSADDKTPEDDSTLLDLPDITPRYVRLREALPNNAGLTLTEKRLLLSQARLLLEHVYVHLHLKKALYGIDPVQRLTLLQYRLENASDVITTSELEFHSELLAIFNDVHDLHTNYILPQPYRSMTAFLPFLLEECFDEQRKPHYIVSKLFRDFHHRDFRPGVEIIRWNGLPIAEAIRQNGTREAGSNHAARFAVGLSSLTIRPLATSLPPDEDIIRLSYRNHGGQVNTIEFEWWLFEHTPPAEEDGLTPMDAEAEELYAAAQMGNYLKTGRINHCRKILYAPDAWRAEQMQDNAERFSLDESLETVFPAIIRARPVTTPHGRFAYIRIFSFIVPQPEIFISEIIRLLYELPQDGLILDVRGNSGGYINMAERLLQLLTPHLIEPEKAQFRANAFTRELCKYNAPSTVAPGIDLSPWTPSLAQAHASGSLYSTAHSLTSPEEANNLGQIYSGPVVLITDAQCYSATDMFAAGFQDHNIGKILGVDDNTGAGGANVWTHYLLRRLTTIPAITANAGTPNLEALPRYADFRVSTRRMLRVKGKSGMPLEDFGIAPDARHYMTRRDLLAGNIDLINHAANLLASAPRYRLQTDIRTQNKRCKLHITATNIDRLDWYIDGRPAGSRDVSNSKFSIAIPRAAFGKTARLEAYAHGEKVINRLVTLACADD